MSIGNAPHSTIWFLLSSFLNASVRSALAAARFTFGSFVSRSDTSGGMPPSTRTWFLMPLFSCARLVTASAARRATLVGTEPVVCGGYRCSSATSPGSAPASAMRFWFASRLAMRLMA